MKNTFVVAVTAVLLAHGAFAAKQLIGSFPNMDGGFEDQAIGPATIVSSISSEQTQWTAQNVNLGATNIATGGRSGPRYMEVNHTGPTHYRLQSPTTSGIDSSTAYAVQFYYKTVSQYVQGSMRVAVSPNGTANMGFYTPYYHTNNVPEWTRYTNVYTTAAAAAGLGLAAISVNSNVQFLIDDVVIYEAPVDETAPDAPTAFASNNVAMSSLDLSWTTPGTGVDGGGYVVVRGTADPATAPNVNGIYALGDAIGAAGTVVYIGTDTTFTDSNLLQNTQYHYRIYTADKAFNYSDALVGVVRTVPEPGVALALLALAGVMARRVR